jgi:hypothetical protein
MTEPLEPSESNNQEYPNPFKYRNLENYFYNKSFKKKRPNIFEHDIRDNIDTVMKENFEFEQQTIKNLFDRY